MPSKRLDLAGIWCWRPRTDIMEVLKSSPCSVSISSRRPCVSREGKAAIIRAVLWADKGLVFEAVAAVVLGCSWRLCWQVQQDEVRAMARVRLSGIFGGLHV